MRLGRAAKWAGGITAGTLLGGTAAAGLAVKSMFNSEERDTPFVDALLEASIGEAQADRMILGADVGITDLLPLPGALRMPRSYRNFQLINPKTFGDIQYTDDLMQEQAEKSFQSNIPYTDQQFTSSSLPYRSSTTRRNYNATGDIVFGMYNSR